MQWLKQSTSITVRLGPFVDSVDGYSPEVGLTISQADIRLSKNGGAFAQTNGVAGATHDENGWYALALNATDTNTLGRLELAIYEVGARPVQREFMVVPANVWDSFFGADELQVDTADIWSYASRTLTMVAETIVSALEGDEVTIRRGDTLSLSITGLGSLVGRTKLYFAVKADPRSDTDAEALILIEETAGLTVLNAAVNTVVANGAIVVDDAVAGDITITIKPAATAVLIPAAQLYASVETVVGAVVSTLAAYDRKITISSDVVRAIT